MIFPTFSLKKRHENAFFRAPALSRGRAEKCGAGREMIRPSPHKALSFIHVGGKVFEGVVGQNNDNILTGGFRTARDLRRGPKCRAGGLSDKKPSVLTSFLPVS
jgi:hypothetical protein